jgi:hypothetical protein
MRWIINKIRKQIRMYKQRRQLKRKLKILRAGDPFIYK